MGAFAFLLSGAAAALYGTGDFVGGLASRRLPASVVVIWSHGVGLAMVVLAAPLLGGQPDWPAAGWGAAAGLAGAAGLVFLYRGLASGPNAVVAPVAALVGAVVPVAFGLALGERPAVIASLGVAAAVPAIALVSFHGERGAGSRGGLANGTGAGIGFGFFFVLISRTGDDAGLWPLVSARVASIVVLSLLVAFVGSVPLRVPRRERPQLVLVGVFDMAANIAFLLAVRTGLLVLVSVISSLYPVVTIVLARIVLDEEIGRVQMAGLVLALTGVTLIAAG